MSNPLSLLTHSQQLELALHRLLSVCLYSGSRNRGINNVIEKNRNLMSTLLQHPKIRKQFIWMEEVLTENELFFHGVKNALKITYSDRVNNELYIGHSSHWPGRNYSPAEVMWSQEWIRENCKSDNLEQSNCISKCYRRVDFLCKFTDYHLDRNRRFFETFLSSSTSLPPWGESWIEEIDFFFLDAREALKITEGSFRQWPKDPDKHLDNWLTSQHQQVAQYPYGCFQDKQQEKREHH